MLFQRIEARRAGGVLARGAGARTVAFVAVGLLLSALPALAQESPMEEPVKLRLLHFSDTHGKLAPHWERFADGRWHPRSGGFAKLATMISELRGSAQGRTLLLANGDNFHGGAELLFTRGRAVVPILDALGIDAYSPGNWDFADGPEELRARFVGTGADGPLVRFPVLAAGVYDADGRPLLPRRFLLRELHGLRVGIIGLNDDKPREQAAAYTRGLDLRAGWDELPALLREVRAAGAELVVALSDAGLAQNVALARDVPGIDVLLSADTHEVTREALVVDGTGTIVVESGEGSRLGQLDLQVERVDGAAVVTSFQWSLHELDEAVSEDPRVAALVAAARAPFLSGPAFVPHRRDYPGAGPRGGLVLREPLDTPIGRADADLERSALFDGLGDDVIADALLELTGADVSATNGFRFDSGVPAGEPITLADAYHWMPVAALVATGEMTGGQLLQRFERFLGSVLDPNPYRRGGGWVPRIAGLRFHVDFTRPRGPTDDRIVRAEVFDRATREWRPLVEDRIYRVASCYAPGDPLDRLCRTDGVRELRFLSRDLESVAPLVAHQPATGTRTQVIPDDALSAVELLPLYLARRGGVLRASDHATARWITAAGERPRSGLLPGLVQPLEGQGPWWLARPRITNETLR